MTRAARPAQAGFTLLEVLVTLAILAYAVIGFHTVVNQSVERALVTKIHRQIKHLVDFQMGQITIGKLHPDEEDPFPDGQTGGFTDVGGYPEEYDRFTWELLREEIPIAGANDDDLEKAGFDRIDGNYVRRQTDDVLAGADENLEQPEGQFKSRVTLIVRWNAPSADQDSEFRIVTYLPVNGEEDQDASGSGDPAAPGDPNAPGGPGGTQSAGKTTLDRSGQKEQR